MPLLAINSMIWLGNLGKMVQVIAQHPLRKLPVPPVLRWLALGGLIASMLWVPLDMYANHKAFKSEFVATTDGTGVGEVLHLSGSMRRGPRGFPN